MNSYDIFHYLIEGPWLVFVAYWIVTGLKTRATVRQESFASRYGVLALEIAGFVLLFNQNASVGVLALHIFPRTMAGAVVGTILTLAGIGLALWTFSSWTILERPYHIEGRSPAYSDRAVRAPSAPHLHRT